MAEKNPILSVFDGESVDSPPVSMRLDLWWNDAVARGRLPSAVAGMGVEEIEDFLCFQRSARFRPLPRLWFGDGRTETETVGDETITRWRLDGGVLTKKVQRSADEARAGISGHAVERPLKDRSDCERFLKALDGAEIRADLDGMDDFVAAVGDGGAPICVLNACPAHDLMINWIGYENFFFFQADFPDLAEAMITELEAIFRRDLWPVAESTPCPLVLHGAHFSQSMTPRPIFKKWFLPYFTEFNDRVRSVGKRTLWHSDADLGDLADLVPEAGFDGADCLATRPLVDRTLGDYLEIWKGRIVCWGGLPSVIFDPTTSREAFDRHVEELLETIDGRNDVIIGASDNVMPGADWERLEFIKERVVSS